MDETSRQGEEKKAVCDKLESARTTLRNKIVGGHGSPASEEAWTEVLHAVSSVLQDPPANFEDARNALLEMRISEGARDHIAELLDIQITKADLRDFHTETGMRAIENCGCKMGGEVFLADLITHYEKTFQSKFTPEIGNALLQLQSEVAHACGDPSYGELVDLLFFSLGCDLHTTQQLVHEQLHHMKQHEKTGPGGNFFVRLQGFFGVFADISQHLDTHCQDKKAIREHSFGALRRVLSHEKLRATKQAGFTPFEALQEELQGSKEKRPWARAKLDRTPYDKEKLGQLITPDVPRELTAQVLVELNDYDYWSQVRNIKKLAMELGRAQNEQKIAHLEQHIRRIATEDLDIEIQDGYPVLQQVERALQKRPDPLEQPVEMRDGRLIPPSLLVLRLLHPKSIVKAHHNKAEDNKQQESVRGIFENLLASLHAPSGDARQEGYNKNMLAESIGALMQSHDPFLHIPMRVGRHGKEMTLWEALIDIGKEQLGTKTLQGVAWLPDGRTENIQAKTFDPKYFNTAQFGHERTWLLDTARCMLREGIVDYKGAVRFFEEEAGAYFGIGRGKNQGYDFHFFPNASIGFEQLYMQHSLHNLEAGKKILISDQEYGTMFTFAKGIQHAEQDEHVHTVYLNEQHNKQADAKDAGKLTQEILRAIQEEDGEIGMIVLSNATRYGDAPCSPSEGPNKNHKHFSNVVAKIREVHPDIPVVVDGCQELGRREPHPLRTMQPTAYLSSGLKSLGAKGGVMAVAKTHTTFSHTPSSTDLTHMLSFALGLRLLRGTHSTDSIPADAMREDSRIHEKLKELTTYALQKTEQYGAELLTSNKLSSEEIEQLQNNELAPEELQKRLSGHVIYPVHRNEENYTGILTIAFPNIHGNKLNNELKKRGFEVLPCLTKDRALRISLDHRQTEENIDALFTAIQDIHAEKLRTDLEEKARAGSALQYSTNVLKHPFEATIAA